MHLILYSKPGCHLCEALEEKLAQVTAVSFDLEIRDINTREDWFQAYQYQIPVLCCQVGDQEKRLPRLSPRASVSQVTELLQKYQDNSL